MESLFQWDVALSALGKVGVAFLLSLPVAWERELAARSAGLRTFPLVAVATCGYVLFAVEVFAGAPDAQARIVQGLITGIGFIGGGAILKTKATVHGTATAASIWNTGAIGTAVAFERYEIGVVLSIVNFATLRLLTRLKEHAANEEPPPQP